MRSSGLTLFTCGGLLLSGGAILGGSTVWSLLRISYYFWTTELGVELAASVLFVVGALLCLPACWLCTVVPYHVKSHSLVATLMTLVTVAMLMLSLGLSSVAELSRAVREPAALNASMQRAILREPVDPSVRSSFAAMQLELKCCGVNSYTDWYHQYNYGHTLPPSCCGRIWNGKRQDRCESPRYAGGCLRLALAELRSYIGALAALSSAIILVLGVTLVTAAYMVVSDVVEQVERKPQPLRIACLAPPGQFLAPGALLPSAPFNTLPAAPLNTPPAAQMLPAPHI